jgi:RHS repeat-associated protein
VSDKPSQLGNYVSADTIATTDNTGTRTGTWTYDPYGNITAHTGTATTPYSYAGEYHDTDTNLTYLRARDYDPTTGSFLTRDPLENITNSPYAYTAGNPLQQSDPTGLIWGSGFVKDHWRGIAKVAAYATVTIVAGACIVGTLGLCSGVVASSLVLFAAGAAWGAADYALSDVCHNLRGYATRMLTGGALTAVGGEYLALRAARQVYVGAARGIAEEGAARVAAGDDPVTVARGAVEARNTLKARSRDGLPSFLQRHLERRSMKRYGDPVGPSFEYLSGFGRSMNSIIESSGRTNPWVNGLLGAR